jgi:hypothetical protein
MQMLCTISLGNLQIFFLIQDIFLSVNKRPKDASRPLYDTDPLVAVAERSKAWSVFDRSEPEIAGSNRGMIMDV